MTHSFGLALASSLLGLITLVVACDGDERTTADDGFDGGIGDETGSGTDSGSSGMCTDAASADLICATKRDVWMPTPILSSGTCPSGTGQCSAAGYDICCPAGQTCTEVLGNPACKPIGSVECSDEKGTGCSPTSTCLTIGNDKFCCPPGQTCSDCSAIATARQGQGTWSTLKRPSGSTAPYQAALPAGLELSSTSTAHTLDFYSFSNEAFLQFPSDYNGPIEHATTTLYDRTHDIITNRSGTTPLVSYINDIYTDRKWQIKSPTLASPQQCSNAPTTEPYPLEGLTAVFGLANCPMLINGATTGTLAGIFYDTATDEWGMLPLIDGATANWTPGSYEYGNGGIVDEGTTFFDLHRAAAFPKAPTDWVLRQADGSYVRLQRDIPNNGKISTSSTGNDWTQISRIPPDILDTIQTDHYATPSYLTPLDSALIIITPKKIIGYSPNANQWFTSPSQPQLLIGLPQPAFYKNRVYITCYDPATPTIGNQTCVYTLPTFIVPTCR